MLIFGSEPSIALSVLVSFASKVQDQYTGVSVGRNSYRQCVNQYFDLHYSNSRNQSEFLAFGVIFQLFAGTNFTQNKETQDSLLNDSHPTL